MKKLLLIIILLLPTALFADSEKQFTAEEIKDLTKKAKKGDVDAQIDLADAYLNGVGVEKDERIAAKWYYKAAMKNNVDAQFAMGFVCRGGESANMDKVLSYMWFELAQKNGNTRAVGLRNDVAWSMTDDEIVQARKKADSWRAGQEAEDYSCQN
ncbi:MAG: tetratricopeptide repeat protein [Pseudomonadota bacterium]